MRSVYLWLGAALFLTGGAVLAFGGAGAGTTVGTVLGLTGVALLVWAWTTGRSPEDES